MNWKRVIVYLHSEAERRYQNIIDDKHSLEEAKREVVVADIFKGLAEALTKGLE